MGKVHYKMYKEGKLWVVAGIASLTFGVGIGYSVTEAHADTSVDSVGTQTNSGTSSTITNSSVALQTTSAATNNQQTSTVSSQAGISSSTSTASSKVNNTQASSNTTSSGVATSQNSDATSTANSGVSTNKALSVNSEASQIQEATSSQNSKTAMAQAVVAPMFSASALAVSDPDTTYTAKITLWNDTTNKPYTGYGVPYASVLDPTTGDYTYTDGTGNTEVYDPSTGQYTYTGVSGTTISDYTLPEPGYKLMNPEALSDNLVEEVNPTVFINWQMPNHDVDITLHYASLADLQVNYIDKNTGNPILITLMPTDWDVPDSGAYLAGDPKAISASKYTISALNIPGYTLVSAPTISGVTNTVATAANPYVQLNFYYQLTDPIAAAGVMPDGKPQVIGLDWSAMPGSFSISGVYGEKNSDDNGDVDAKMANLVQQYATQGYTLAGIVGTYENNDYFNYRQAGIWIHFMPNKDVTVNYVDENGKSLATQVTLASNSNNLNQQNSGIDPNNYWQPAGNWQVSAPDFKGYELDTTKSKNMVNGTFAPFSQTVTFVYKDVLLPVGPNNPENPGNPIDPSNPNGPTWPNGTDKSSLTSVGIRTIEYLDKQTGQPIKVAETNNGSLQETVNFSRTAIVDEVTGEIVGYDTTGDGTVDTTDANAAWVADGSTDYDEQVSPNLSKYGYGTSDISDVAAQTANAGDNLIVTVTYDHLNKTVTPNDPGTPGQPIDPSNPTGPKYPNGTDRNSLVNNVTRVITYVDKQTGQEVAPSVSQAVSYERTATIDEVNGGLTYSDWKLTTPSDTLEEVISPNLRQDGYIEPNLVIVPEETINATYNGNKNITIVVVYSRANKPGKPTKPANPNKPGKPIKPVNPNKPGNPTKSSNPSKPDNPTEPVKPNNSDVTNLPGNPSKLVTPTMVATPRVTSNKHQDNIETNKLPQTGEKQDNGSSLLGVVLLGLTGTLMGLYGSIRKSKNN